jgi:ribosomal protein S12 methylthiotransferase
VKTYYLLSLGCSKNTVDSESIAQLLGASGYRGLTSPERADVLIVNTCGFIGPARDESIRALRELAGGKRKHQQFIAAGCLSQLWGPRLAEEVPGLDGVIGTRRWMDIVDLIGRLRGRPRPGPLYHLPTDAATVGDDPESGPPLVEDGRIPRPAVLRAAVQGASAYVKIADGCRRPCAFCSIPNIKGTMKSRPPERILAEARQLERQGVRELILIAQDLTDYGSDLGLKDGLAGLLGDLCDQAPGIDWIRLMYAYPGAVTDRLIETMASQPRICHYLDIPLQHAHPDTLRRMRRPANVDWVRRAIGKMRAAMPDLCARTTFIVGYPGETEAEFGALRDFVAEMQFDRVGVFPYSFEPGTPSALLPGQVDEETKQARRDALMRAQQRISLARNQQFVGRTLTALIEGHDNQISFGRSYRDAPEVDGLVLIEGTLPAGEMVPVRINGALEYDLTGTVDIAQPAVVL